MLSKQEQIMIHMTQLTLLALFTALALFLAGCGEPDPSRPGTVKEINRKEHYILIHNGDTVPNHLYYEISTGSRVGDQVLY